MDQFRNEIRFIVPPDRVHVFLEELKNRHGFDMLVDVTCVDYLDYPIAQRESERSREEGEGHLLFHEKSTSFFTKPFFDRFGLVYVLADTTSNRRVVVRTFVGEDNPIISTVFDLWQSANWLEREVWDLFGIRFEGHPDLRRIVLPEAFESHPLRRDYPLQGLGERHNLPVISRKES